MKQVFRIDADGNFVEPVLLPDMAEIPEDCTELTPPDGLFKPKWDAAGYQTAVDEYNLAYETYQEQLLAYQNNPQGDLPTPPDVVDYSIFWVEGMPQEEIDTIRNQPQSKTPVELLQEENAMLALELALSQERLLASEQAQADLLFELSTKGVI